jgi:hypothetical protein
MKASPLNQQRGLKCISLLTILSVFFLTTLACSLGAPGGGGPSPAGKATEPAKSAPPTSLGGEPGDAAAVLAKLPAPPQSRAITLGDLPKDTGEAFKAMFGLDGSEPMFLSDTTPEEVIQFYADELSQYGYANPAALVFDQGKFVGPIAVFFREGSKEAIRCLTARTKRQGRPWCF